MSVTDRETDIGGKRAIGSYKWYGCLEQDFCCYFFLSGLVLLSPPHLSIVDTVKSWLPLACDNKLSLSQTSHYPNGLAELDGPLYLGINWVSVQPTYLSWGPCHLYHPRYEWVLKINVMTYFPHHMGLKLYQSICSIEEVQPDLNETNIMYDRLYN